VRSQKILPPQMSDDPLLDLVAFAKRLDQPEILVPTIGCLDGAKEQATPSVSLLLAARTNLAAPKAVIDTRSLRA